MIKGENEYVSIKSVHPGKPEKKAHFTLALEVWKSVYSDNRSLKYSITFITPTPLMIDLTIYRCEAL